MGRFLKGKVLFHNPREFPGVYGGFLRLVQFGLQGGGLFDFQWVSIVRITLIAFCGNTCYNTNKITVCVGLPTQKFFAENENISKKDLSVKS